MAEALGPLPEVEVRADAERPLQSPAQIGVSSEPLPSSYFSCTLNLNPGVYQYKYIVDGEWRHSPYQDPVADGKGGLNNIIVINPYYVDPFVYALI